MGNLIVSHPDKNQFIPTKALVIYSNEKINYIEMADINNGKIGSFSPLLEEEVKQLAVTIGSIGSATFGESHPQLLYYMPGANMVWYKPAGKYKIPLGNKIYDVYLPGMIFVLKSITLHVYCYIRFDGIHTQMYRAPFANVYDDDHVCLGNAQSNIEATDIKTTIERYNDLFFNSSFNSNHSENRILNNKAQYNQFFIRKCQKQKFPNNRLVPLKKALIQLLK